MFFKKGHKITCFFSFFMVLYSSWLTNGCVAQLARAFGSYPTGRWFESVRSHQHRSLWPHGQAVKTPPFHGGIMGSNPVGVTKQVKGEPVSIRRRIRLYHILQKDLLNEKRRTRVYLTRRFCFVTTVFQIRRFCRLCISDILLFVKRIIH